LKPALYVKPHWLFEHVGAPLSGAGQALSHVPQWSGDLDTSTHDPAQFVSPSGQLPITHLPLAHTSFAPHAVAQSPQCAGSEASWKQPWPHAS
jgi:hypothetical protein